MLMETIRIAPAIWVLAIRSTASAASSTVKPKGAAIWAAIASRAASAA